VIFSKKRTAKSHPSMALFNSTIYLLDSLYIMNIKFLKILLKKKEIVKIIL